MLHKPNSVGLPAGIIQTFDTGCPGYEPLKNVPFVPQVGRIFNPRLAEWSINACTYAYQNLCNMNNIIFPPEVEDGKLLYWDEDAGFFGKKKIPCGYIAKIKPIEGDSTNRVVIIFRGTQNDDEWKLDSFIKQRQLIMEPSGELVKIHKGFWEIFNSPVEKGLPSLQEQLHQLLPTYLSKTTENELHIGAHSMGSAIAVLSFTDTILRFPNLTINTYITGCPRVGDPAFANAINALAKNPNYNFSLWRIANTEDIITTLPPPFIGRHLYSHLLISDRNDPNVVDLISFTKNLGRIFDNHHLFNYYYAMKTLVSEERKGRHNA